MTRGVRLYLVGFVALVALAGCGRAWVQLQDRDSWRHQAEVDCLKTGSVKVGTAIVRAEPIAGPGMCGADFPLKVAALGANLSLGYADDLRPPGAIPNGSAAQPRWPAAAPRYAPPSEYPAPPAPRSVSAPSARPLSILPPGIKESDEDDIPDDAELPSSRRAPATQPAYRPPPQRAVPEQRALPPLGPARGRYTGAVPAASVTPTATLACPIVSALDQWVAAAVQPAALRWFNQPVVEIKQISAYSCRGMNGQAGARISEHAFGNALDIAAFVLADGRKITVKNGWNGTPEEQAFLHDVQGAACQQFNTVLAPGSNRFHYDHIHVDLMRRASGRRVCQPNAIDGEVVAARAGRSRMAKRGDPTTTGSITLQSQASAKQNAIPGEDGYFADDDDDDAAVTTGSIPQAPAKPASAKGKSAKPAAATPAPALKAAIPGEDGAFDDEDEAD